MLKLIENLSTTELVVWSVWLSCAFFQIVYLLVSYRKLLFYKSDNTLKDKPLSPISVIICAQNEARNLERFLPLILEQSYPDFQVVVVNDCSEDDSEEVLELLKDKYSHLYVSHVKKDPIYRHSKKLAITLGIKAARHERLIFTDANCYPSSQKWLQAMAKHFSDEKQIVLGASAHEKQKGLLGQVIAYDTLQSTISYVSGALRSRTYGGTGRNIGYTKTLFYEHKGFSGHTHLLAGDDDLFINKIATKENVAVELSQEALIKTVANERSMRDWFKQKRRVLSTRYFYKKRQKLYFATKAVVGFLFYIAFVSTLFLNIYPLISSAVFLFSFLTKSTLRGLAARKICMGKAFFFQSLWLDILVPLFVASIHLVNKVKPLKFMWR